MPLLSTTLRSYRKVDIQEFVRYNRPALRLTDIQLLSIKTIIKTLIEKYNIIALVLI